ncbi:hypothetical protein ACNKHR_10300 [Shigella flexneri]
MSGFDRVEIVLNHHNGIALMARFCSTWRKMLNIGEVQTGWSAHRSNLPGAAF